MLHRRAGKPFYNQPTFPLGWEFNYYVIRCGSKQEKLWLLRYLVGKSQPCLNKTRCLSGYLHHLMLLFECSIYVIFLVYSVLVVKTLLTHLVVDLFFADISPFTFHQSWGLSSAQWNCSLWENTELVQLILAAVKFTGCRSDCQRTSSGLRGDPAATSRVVRAFWRVFHVNIWQIIWPFLD